MWQGGSSASVPIDLFLYEILNGTLTCMYIMLIAFIARYQWIEYWTNGFERKRSQLSTAILVLSIGELVTRGWTFVVRHLDALRYDVAWLGAGSWKYVPIIGAGITCIGACCAVRVLVPDDWGGSTNRGWTMCALITAVFTVFIILWR